jgi:endoglucanase
LSVNPRLLIFVEGVQYHGGVGSWWGGNLMGVRDSPINLAVPNKLVYSPHVYGPSVYAQPYFSDAAFPNNLPAIWDGHWAFVERENRGTLVVGEWGGWMRSENRDDVWHNAMGAFLREREIDYFYWCLNPNSGDTGGLLGDDWRTPVTAKLQLLDRVSPNPSRFSLADVPSFAAQRPPMQVSPPSPQVSQPSPQVSQPSPQVSPPSPQDRPLPPMSQPPAHPSPPLRSVNWTSALVVRVVSSVNWTNGPKQFHAQNVEVTNPSPGIVRAVHLYVDCDIIEQVWNCASVGKTLSFPSWIPGLRRGETWTLGYIVSGKVPTIRIVT